MAHELLPDKEYLPLGQSVQLVDPILLLNLPAAQALQAAEPSLHLPTGHVTQLLSPAAAHDPAPHEEQDEAACLLILPAGHVAQEVLPLASLKVPAAHSTHLLRETALP